MSGASVQGVGAGVGVITTDRFCRLVMAYQLAVDECLARPNLPAPGGKCDPQAPCLTPNPVCHQIGPLWDRVMQRLDDEKGFVLWDIVARLMPRGLRNLFD